MESKALPAFEDKVDVRSPVLEYDVLPQRSRPLRPTKLVLGACKGEGGTLAFVRQLEGRLHRNGHVAQTRRGEGA